MPFMSTSDALVKPDQSPLCHYTTLSRTKTLHRYAHHINQGIDSQTLPQGSVHRPMHKLMLCRAMFESLRTRRCCCFCSESDNDIVVANAEET